MMHKELDCRSCLLGQGRQGRRTTFVEDVAASNTQDMPDVTVISCHVLFNYIHGFFEKLF
jgi:hypothetical protein